MHVRTLPANNDPKLGLHRLYNIYIPTACIRARGEREEKYK